MSTINETKINAEMPVEAQVENTPEEKKISWKEVSLGGVAGIVLGTAATAGIEAAASPKVKVEIPSEEEAEEAQPADIPEIGDNVEVAQNVDDEMTFAESFAAAREEVGAGGVFVWRGEVYSTYNKAEWDAMTDEQKADFSKAVLGTDVVEEEIDDDHNTLEDLASKVNWLEERVDDLEDKEVNVISVKTADGMEAEVYDVDGDGTADVAVVDVDDDGEPDLMAADVNGDGVVDESELYQVTEDGVVSLDSITDADMTI